MALQIGRKGRLYTKLETGGYATTQTIAGSNALRHIDVKFDFNPFNRVNSPEKKQSPGQVTIFDRRMTAGLGSLSGLLRPSGTLNTLPECSPVLEAAFGSKTNVTLDTTIASGAAIGGATLTAATGLAVGDGLLLIDGTTGLLHVRRITAVNTGTGVTTWAPNLPNAPAGGSQVRAGISYKITTDLALSLVFLHCLPNFRREMRGVAIDKLGVAFDANEEPRFTASGPGQRQYSDAAAVADPTTFTTVGGNPPSGLIGDLYIGNTAYLFKKFSMDMTNGMALRNQEYNGNAATEVYRRDRQQITCKLDAFAETAATLYDLAKAGTTAGVFKQTGRTVGNIVALALPKVNWDVPDTSDGDAEVDWSFSGLALESADSANDQAYLYLF